MCGADAGDVPTPNFLLTCDAAEILGVTDDRVRQLVVEGRLSVAATAGRRKAIALFAAADVEALAGGRANAAIERAARRRS